jgi:ATP-dependent DNA helicase RecG
MRPIELWHVDQNVQTIEITINKHVKPRGKSPWVIEGFCEAQPVRLNFFHGYYELDKRHPVGTNRFVSAQFSLENEMIKAIHPDYITQDLSTIPPYEPIYPQTQGLGSRKIAKLIQSALLGLKPLPEWRSHDARSRAGELPFYEALLKAHSPQSDDDSSPHISISRLRLAYDEALAHHLVIQLRKSLRERQSAPIIIPGPTHDYLKTALPFALTKGQISIHEQIHLDLKKGYRTNRLIQGDVGTGKTILVFLSAASAIDSGFQSAIMAPTEILAQQHYEKAKPLFERAGKTVLLLTGSDKGKQRDSKRKAIETGEVDLIIGTHALLTPEVRYHRLGLAVIDEQHRFGVNQRQNLLNKGEAVHTLVLSATPIPRTLALSAYGELDISALRDRPAHQQPIETALVSRQRLDLVIERLKAALERNLKAYWVCPMVEELEEQDFIAIIARYEALKIHFGAKVGLVHGRLSAQEKADQIEDFRLGKIDILCATSVIEVGVDVPNATVMLIENAERFGLSQLHQLRGRVGRGGNQSYCILIVTDKISKEGRKRLAMMEETQDGFKIAEADLEIRGPGDFMGTRQSGLPEFKIASISEDGTILQDARERAFKIIEQDPELSHPALIEVKKYYEQFIAHNKRFAGIA